MVITESRLGNPGESSPIKKSNYTKVWYAIARVTAHREQSGEGQKELQGLCSHPWKDTLLHGALKGQLQTGYNQLVGTYPRAWSNQLVSQILSTGCILPTAGLVEKLQVAEKHFSKQTGLTWLSTEKQLGASGLIVI